MYKLTNIGVRRLSDNAEIPIDIKNKDYRKYLKWLEEDNIPEPMDIIDPWIKIRQERNLILQSTDWTQMPDAPLTETQKTEWKTYRQKLRDLPQNNTDIKKIKWPDKTSLVKAD